MVSHVIIAALLLPTLAWAGSLTLRWTEPIWNADEPRTRLTDLSHYVVHAQVGSKWVTRKFAAPSPAPAIDSVVKATVKNIPSGRYPVYVTAVDLGGHESKPSNIKTGVVP